VYYLLCFYCTVAPKCYIIVHFLSCCTGSKNFEGFDIIGRSVGRSVGRYGYWSSPPLQNLVFLAAINWYEFLPVKLGGAKGQFAASFSRLSASY
jgi:hypothetical protein